jgi:hypothetical protein
MLRLIPSFVALSAAMLIAGPSFAADYNSMFSDDGSDSGGDGSLRSAYPTEPGDWAGLGDKDDSMQFEFGMRYWYSMGAISASSSGTATSSTDTSHIGELHLRIEDHSTNTFAKAIAGFSIASTGNYDNGVGTGTIADGHVGYVGADLGWNTFGDNNGSGAGLLVGYEYWKEALNTGRNNYTTAQPGDTIPYDQTTGQSFLPGDSAPNNLDINLLRLGVSAKAKLGDFFDVSAELVGVPYAKVSGQLGVDDPTFDTSIYGGPAQAPYGAQNGNISTMRSSPTSVDGWGYGAMAEAWLGMHPTQNLTFRLGGRAWYLQGTVDETYTCATIGNPSNVGGAPPVYDTAPQVTSNNGFISTANPFSLLRYGVLAEATYAF